MKVIVKVLLQVLMPIRNIQDTAVRESEVPYPPTLPNTCTG